MRRSFSNFFAKPPNPDPPPSTQKLLNRFLAHFPEEERCTNISELQAKFSRFGGFGGGAPRAQ